MSREFRGHLTALADTMNGVDMYDEVLRASHRRKVRRGVVTAVAVAAVAGLVGVGLTVLPDAGAETPPASEDKKDESLDHIPGSLYYSDESAQYHIVDDGEVVDSPWVENPAVSHDGGTAAWLESGGYLMVEDTDGTLSGQFPPAEDEEAVSGECVWPTWSPIDDQLLYAVAVDGDESKLRVRIRDVPSGELKASFLAEGACNFQWAADGSGLVAQKGYQGDMVAMDVDGTGKREFTVPAGGGEVSLFSVSAGGEEVCVEQGFQHSDDALYSSGCNATHATATGDPSGPATGGGGVRAVFYTADGNVLVRLDTENGMKVTLHDPQGEVLGEYEEPRKYAGYTLAHYLP